jgi:hypothetical protein
VTRNTYNIRNIATEVLPHPLYLTLDSGRVVCESYRPGLSVWAIFKNARGDAYGFVESVFPLRLFNLSTALSLPTTKQIKTYISLVKMALWVTSISWIHLAA